MHRINRDEKGIAMTEAVIVIPFFILIWMVLIYLHSICNARLEAQVKAHHTAFTQAMGGNCSGSFESDKADGDEVRHTVDGVTSELSISESASPGGDALFDWSHHVISTVVTADNLPNPIGGPTQDTRGKARVMCNSKPEDSLSAAFYASVNQLSD